MSVEPLSDEQQAALKQKAGKIDRLQTGKRVKRKHRNQEAVRGREQGGTTKRFC